MKTLNFNKIKEEFVLLTYFHGQNFIEEIAEMDVPEEMKDGFKAILTEFLHDVVSVTESDLFKTQK